MVSVFRVLSVAFVVLSLFTVLGTTSAQTSIYATGASTAFGFSGDSYPNGPSFKPRSDGFMLGAHYMFHGFNRFKAGVDARYNSSAGYNGGRAYTGGVRVAWVPYRFRLRPYAGFGGGAVSTQLRQNICNGPTCNQTTSRITSGVVRLDAGFDVHLNRLFDIRAFDYEFDTGGTAGLTSATMRSFSAGIVFHLPTPERKNP
jgi:hypothetical protein